MTNPGLQSIADLTASTRITTGDIPPPLVGSSTTVIRNRLYLFAGRLVSSRRMTNDLYILDLDTFIWTKFFDEEKVAPKSRYFHSANQYKNTIVFFGGMGYSRTSNDGLCVLDDVSIFDLETNTWRHPEIIPSSAAPRPRYAHLAAVTATRLVVVGGQDMSNSYIEEINVLDLEERVWTSSRPFEKHCGAYRSVAVSSTSHINLPLFANAPFDFAPSEEIQGPPPDENGTSNPLRKSISAQSLPASSAMAGNTPRAPPVGTFGNRVILRRTPSGQNLIRTRSLRRSPSSGNPFYRLSYTTNATEENPNPIYLYSNYNFTDVKRELQVIAPPTTSNYQIMDYSNNMTGAFLPPGLRFPTGSILGHHLIISGTYLTNTSQTFSIWALNLANLVWTRIDTGSCFTQGSWNRGVLCESTNTYIVLGHRERSLVEDYNHRQTNFDHVTLVDLEAFGVYQPPPTTMSPVAQELGLALMNEPNMADFEIITLDQQRIPVNSQLLSTRWSQFKMLVDAQAERVAELHYDHNQPIPIEEQNAILMYKNRVLEFPEPFNVTLAFLQYLYTDHLLTAQQHQPHILSQLLLLADMYDLDRLRQLATHALHQALTMATAALIYETAALSRQTGLQIRALKVMIAAKKMVQQQQQQQQMAPNHQSNGTHMSMVGEDLMSPQWANIVNSSGPPSAALDPRTSYYDPYGMTVNSPPPNQVTTRVRSSSCASLSGPMSTRGYLPTIPDTTPSEVMFDDGQSSASTATGHVLQSSTSHGSLRSIRAQRNFVNNHANSPQPTQPDSGFFVAQF